MTTWKTVATTIIVIAIAFAASVGGAYLRSVTDEANVLKATLAEMQQSRHSESHPYFWFCPEPGECAAEDGYLTWYSAHGGS